MAKVLASRGHVPSTCTRRDVRQSVRLIWIHYRYYCKYVIHIHSLDLPALAVWLDKVHCWLKRDKESDEREVEHGDDADLAEGRHWLHH